MKKFLVGALSAVMLLSVSAFTEASQTQFNEQCCRGDYYCAQGDDANGGYCDGYGCGYARGGYGRDGYGRGGYCGR